MEIFSYRNQLISTIQGFTDPEFNQKMEHPDDSTSLVIYNREYQLLYQLQQLLGDENYKLMLKHIKQQNIDKYDFY
ncbi:unnamed protein product [Paramecium sonneborni]|uniref:Uncharacterized protein n=1 Tax=Paramecium sonneborni TaxID=65129 RepID=A0A8S1MLC0_9CILI|nr:unnamed protein product [Paramecium sonneborni]